MVSICFIIFFNLPPFHIEIHFNIIRFSTPSTHSVVTRVTRLRAGRPRNSVSIFDKDKRFPLCLKRPEPFWSLPTLISNGYQSLSIGIRYPARGTHHSPSFVQKLRICGVIPPLPPIHSWCTKRQISTSLLGLPSCLFVPVFPTILAHSLLFPSVHAT